MFLPVSKAIPCNRRLGAGKSGKLGHLDLVVEDILEPLSKHPDDYEIIAAIVAGLFIIGAAFISRREPNRRLDRKKSKLRGKLKRTCPHVEAMRYDGTVFIYSLCNSVGQNPWLTCSLCGKRFAQEEHRSMVDLWTRKTSEKPCLVHVEGLQNAVTLRERLDELDGE